jgi:hypothetical protein
MIGFVARLIVDVFAGVGIASTITITIIAARVWIGR